ncbi:MAG: ABC transporter ATP-binding protein [Bacteroidota bacterium]
MGFLTVSGISKKMQQVAVVSDISFEQRRFQKIAIAGETGSGKSTLLKMIAGLEQPVSGSIFFEDDKVVGPDYQLIPGHPGIAYLSQHYELRNNYRVEELLEYANKLPQADADTLFAICQIGHLVKRKVDQLSGGEKQRIALARLLVGSPKLLLLDEPFSNLDPIHKQILKSVLTDIGERLSISCILTSHDPMDTLSWADTILVMKNGRIEQTASPQEVYHYPVNRYVAGLFGSYNLLEETACTAMGIPVSIGEKGKQFFLRPERVRLTPNTAESLNGTVTDIRFWGSFYEVSIRVNNNWLLAKTMLQNIRIGDTVSIALEYNNAWYI